jgi:hypothetical protein
MTSEANKDQQVAKLAKKFAATVAHASATVVVAANRTYCSTGPLAMTVQGKQTTSGQIVDSASVQLNYLVPLKNLGFVPESWLVKEKLERLEPALKNATSLAQALTAVKQPGGQEALSSSLVQVFVSLLNNKFPAGSYWFPRAQLAAHKLVEAQLAAYETAGESRDDIDALLLKSIFTVYLFDMAYETSLDSASGTQKDNCGHLVKSVPLDLVRLTTNDSERAFLLWFASRDTWLKTLDDAILNVSRGPGTSPKVLKFLAKNEVLPPYSVAATDAKPPTLVEQIHKVTFLPGLATLFYDEAENADHYATARRPNTPTELFRAVKMIPTSSVFAPVMISGEWYVLLESRSPAFTVSRLLVPDGANAEAKEILDVIQKPLWE